MSQSRGLLQAAAQLGTTALVVVPVAGSIPGGFHRPRCRCNLDGDPIILTFATLLICNGRVPIDRSCCSFPGSVPLANLWICIWSGPREIRAYIPYRRPSAGVVAIGGSLFPQRRRLRSGAYARRSRSIER